MSIDFALNAEPRTDKGKGASRRLRGAGRVPAILYGENKESLPLALNHNELLRSLEHEAFYSHVLTVNIDGKAEKAIVRDLQRHPAKPQILHVDLQRVSEDHEIRVVVPLHFVNESMAHGVKQQGGAISHLVTEVEVSCLPAKLPEFIEVDLTELHLNEAIRLSDLQLPEGVALVELTHGAERDLPVVSIHPTRGAEAAGAGEEGEAAPEGGEA